jgi:hypothetical protein
MEVLPHLSIKPTHLHGLPLLIITVFLMFEEDWVLVGF